MSGTMLVCAGVYIGETGCVHDLRPVTPLGMVETRAALADRIRSMRPSPERAEIRRRADLWLQSEYWARHPIGTSFLDREIAVVQS